MFLYSSTRSVQGTKGSTHAQHATNTARRYAQCTFSLKVRNVAPIASSVFLFAEMDLSWFCGKTYRLCFRFTGQLGGQQRQIEQTYESTQQRTSGGQTTQSYQQRTEKTTYSNGHTLVEEVSKYPQWLGRDMAWVGWGEVSCFWISVYVFSNFSEFDQDSVNFGFIINIWKV